MNDKDKESVFKLRAELKDITNHETLTDFDLLRWLHGFDNKMAIVLPKLREHLHFMNAFDFESYEPVEVMKKYWPFGLLGPTGKNDDNLVFIECAGCLDGEGILKSVRLSDVMKFVVKAALLITGKIHEKEYETERPWGLVHIIDLEHMVLDSKQLGVITGPYRLLVKFFMAHSVEVARKIIWVNSPNFVHYLFQIVKHFVPERTRKKVIILGADWRTKILDHVDAQCLPVHWGGTMVDEVTGDAQCSSKIRMPRAPVDSQYFWQPTENDPRKEDLNILTVGSWKREFINVEVTKPGSQLDWYFWSDGDFGFGVFYPGFKENGDLDSDTNMVMVYPYVDRLPGPSKLPEHERIVCHKAGCYKLLFNNSFSWVSSLKIYYRVRVI